MMGQSWVRADLQLGQRWLLVGCLGLATVITLSLLPFKSEPTGFTYIDKFMHLFAYIGLMLFFNGFLKPQLRLKLIVMLLICGILIELLQIPVPGRSADLADFAANVTGITMGWVLIRFGKFNWCHWVEARLLRND